MLAFSPIPMFDRMDHPSVPTTFPWRTAVDGGQGWPQGHREAASSVLEGHPPPCDAGDRRALGHTSASHDPYRHREAELGSPSKSGTAIPSIIVLLLIYALGIGTLPAICQSDTAGLGYAEVQELEGSQDQGQAFSHAAGWGVPGLVRTLETR